MPAPTLERQAGTAAKSTAAAHGITFGCALAVVISYTAHKSIGWAIVHGFLSWLYVLYAAVQ